MFPGVKSTYLLFIPMGLALQDKEPTTRAAEITYPQVRTPSSPLPKKREAPQPLRPPQLLQLGPHTPSATVLGVER